jgi:hypothetical protein
MTTIHFIDGEKGGTGKSWIARTIHHTLVSRNLDFQGVDANISCPSYRQAYPEVLSISLALNPQGSSLADTLFELGLTSDMIVDLPPQSHEGVFYWINTYNFLTLCKEQGITLKKWWITCGEQESVQLLQQSIDAYGDSIQHILVRNFNESEWQYFEDDQLLQSIIREHQIPVIDFPRLADLHRRDIGNHHLSFEAARCCPELGIQGKAQIEHYLEQSAAALIAGGVLGQPSDAAMLLARSPLLRRSASFRHQSLNDVSTHSNAKPLSDALLAPFHPLLMAMDEHSQMQLCQALYRLPVDCREILLAHMTTIQALIGSPDKIKTVMLKLIQDNMTG